MADDESAPADPTLLDAIVMAVQKAEARADVNVQPDTDVAVRPLPFSDPWAAGGGVVGR